MLWEEGKENNPESHSEIKFFGLKVIFYLSDEQSLGTLN